MIKLQTAKEAFDETNKYFNLELDEAIKLIKEYISSRIIKKRFFVTIHERIVTRNIDEIIKLLTNLGYKCEPHYDEAMYCSYVKISWNINETK